MLFGDEKDGTPVERALDFALDFSPGGQQLNKIDKSGTKLAKEWFPDKDEKAFSVFGYDVKKREIADVVLSFNPAKSFKEIFTGENFVCTLWKKG